MKDLLQSLEPVTDATALARRGADLVAQCAREALAARGAFSLALTGGSSPLDLYALLATEPYRTVVDPSRTEFFWGDERAVPPSDANSNYKSANERWLTPAGAPPDRVHRMPGERADLEAAAKEYEAVARAKVAASEPGGDPAFDLVLLGVGADGHVLSMFPHCVEIERPSALVVALHDPPMNPRISRISFTRRLLESARCVLVLANGAQKAEPLRALLEGEGDEASLPVRMIKRCRGRVVILADQAARAKLTR